MSVETELVGGYGFTFTEAEGQKYLEALGGIVDDVHDDVFKILHRHYDGLHIRPVGDQWSGPTGYLVYLAGTDPVSSKTDELGMYKTFTDRKSVTNEVYDARNRILGDNSDRYIGYQYGIYVH